MDPKGLPGLAAFRHQSVSDGCLTFSQRRRNDGMKIYLAVWLDIVCDWFDAYLFLICREELNKYRSNIPVLGQLCHCQSNQ